MDVPVEQLGVHEPEPDALLGFLREMEFATLTKRIAEGLGAEVPPPAERPRRSPACRKPAARPHGSKAAAAERGAGCGRRRQAAVVAALKAAKAQKIDRSKYETVTELAQLEAWIAEARAAGRFAFDTETTSLDPMQAEFVGFSHGRGARQGLLRAARASRGAAAASTSATASPSRCRSARRWPC